MANASDFYFDVLYPFQDRVIQVVNQADTGFYLTGGTAASRGYLQHRFSDDLDYFANDDNRFGLWTERVIQALNEEWNCDILMKEERFARINLLQKDFFLKIEMVNDVPARVGEVQDHPVLGRMDTAENILANKVTALLDRDEPKDLADIWGFCTQMGLSIHEALIAAQGKAAGIFPLDLARVLLSTTKSDWSLIRWLNPPQPDQFIEDLHKIGEQIVLSP